MCLVVQPVCPADTFLNGRAGVLHGSFSLLTIVPALYISLRYLETKSMNNLGTMQVKTPDHIVACRKID